MNQIHSPHAEDCGDFCIEKVIVDVERNLVHPVPYHRQHIAVAAELVGAPMYNHPTVDPDVRRRTRGLVGATIILAHGDLSVRYGGTSMDVEPAPDLMRMGRTLAPYVQQHYRRELRAEDLHADAPHRPAA